MRASKAETLRRAVERTKLDRDANTELVEKMWIQFPALGEYERCVIDTENLTIGETVCAIKAKVADKSALLG